jgi:MoaA/NifB/PqqE/SkfB family radical SAM enzyme
MCDIWKGNNNVKQLEEADIDKMLESMRKLNTKIVVMSGGEALMHPNFFRLCEIIKSRNISITLLSTGLLLKKFASEIIAKTDEVIVSLDGSKEVHDKIRNIPNAFDKLKEGLQELKRLNSKFRVTARCVIQKENFEDLLLVVDAAREIGIDQISFLTADLTTDAFNRSELWGEEKVNEVRLSPEELERFNQVIEKLIETHSQDFNTRFIAESPEKIRKFYEYYAAFQGLTQFPPVRCNAPWVSTVIEADGSVRPCFFHEVIGDIREESLAGIINSEKSITFRKNLDVSNNYICKKCVCSLNLSPFTNL